MAPKTGTGSPDGPAHNRGASLSPRNGAGDTKLVRVLGFGAPVPVFGQRDQRVAMIAEAQRGRVTRQQLRDAGVGDNAIDRLARKGSLHRLHRGVYVVGHRAEVPLGNETAVLLACGEGAVLSHASAAAMWGLRPSAAMPTPVEVTVREARSVRILGVRWHRTRTLRTRDVRILEFLPVTSPARTLVDIAGTLPSRELELALDEGLRNRTVTRVQVADAVRHASNRRGAGLLRSLVSDGRAPTITRSEAEERLLALIRHAGLRPPELNVRLHGFTVDFLWRREGIVVEVDGYRFHGSRRRFEDDRVRDAKLAASGYTVIRVTWRQMQDEPYAVVARLAQALARAERRSINRLP